MNKNYLKNILLIGPYPPPFGGIASHLEYLVSDLKREGFRIFIITNSKKQELIKKDGLEILRWCSKKKLHLLLKPQNIFLNIRCFKVLRRYKLSIKNILREIIFVNILKDILINKEIKLISFYEIASGYSIPVLRKALKVKIPIVLSMYADIYENFSYLQPRSGLVKTMFEISNKTVASSKYSAKSVELFGLDSSRIEPIYYGVDLNRFHPRLDRDKIRKELGLNSTCLILLFVGRMQKSMGLNVILEIAPQILSQKEDVVFIIGGTEGELTKQAYDLAEKYKNRIYVKVNIPFNELPYYYATCDVLLAPSRSKHASMGMSIKEVMASGKPVIATNSPGIAEAVVEGETGFLVQTDEDFMAKSEDLGQAILKALGNPAQLKYMGEKARKRAEELFDKDLTSKKMIDIFKNLLENPLSFTRVKG